MSASPIEPSATFRGRAPTALAFGTSGLRGLVSDITDLEAYVNTAGFLDYLVATGDLTRGGPVAVAGDLRPSTNGPDRSIMRAVARATVDAGFGLLHCGQIPTPALINFAMGKGWPSIMITGSHIPFDRNGIKFNKSTGEVLKPDEEAILRAIAQVRRREYARAPGESLFGDDGMFRTAAPALPSPTSEPAELYVRRYLDFFGPGALDGTRVAVYQHSAVGREILVEILAGLGAQVFPVGRTEHFVPIDTEALPAAILRELQSLADGARRSFGVLDAIVSTDGDSDRPLLLGVNPEGRIQFFGGDAVGIVVADYLAVDGVAVPITVTDALDIHLQGRAAIMRTRIGSPWVAAALQALPGRRRAGWEANGGFLTGSDVERDGRRLTALPTRDAALPIVAALCAARQRRQSLGALFAALPRRFSTAGLIDQVSAAAGRALASYLTPEQPGLRAVSFAEEEEEEEEEAVVTWVDAEGSRHQAHAPLRDRLRRIRADLGRQFNARRGFGAVSGLDYLDGIRVSFAGGDIAHIRQSGNAPQLRIYAVSSSEERAGAIVDMALAEPDGILRALLSDAG